MKLYVTRHGQTNYNVAGLCNADPSVDVYLTALGIQQAQSVGDQLKNEQFDAIVISPLKRTKQTADIINQYHRVPLVVDERITDNTTGFEGKPVAEYYAARDAAPDKWSYKPKGAESRNDVKARVVSFLDSIKSGSYESVLLVSHQSVIRQLFGTIQELTKDEIELVDLAQGEYVLFELQRPK